MHYFLVLETLKLVKYKAIVLNSGTGNAHFVHFISFYSLQELLQFLINLYLGLEAKYLYSKGTNLLTKRHPKQ